jgi:DNA-nicking Smr family endonuclease
MTADEPKHRRRRLNDAERALWRGVTRSVVPLKRRRPQADEAESEPMRTPRTAAPALVKASPRPRAIATPAAPALVAFDRRAKQRLARGSDAIDARLDLHGRSQREAHSLLLRFLARAQGKGAKIVLVITGKGVRATDTASERGVLKRQVPQWLQLPEFRAYVLSVDDAHAAHGGAGALYVRLRRAGSP